MKRKAQLSENRIRIQVSNRMEVHSLHIIQGILVSSMICVYDRVHLDDPVRWEKVISSAENEVSSLKKFC